MNSTNIQADRYSFSVTIFHCMVLLALLGFVSLCKAAAPADQHRQFAVGIKRTTFIDKTRGIKPSGEFPGSDERRVDVVIWYPTAVADGEPVEGAPLAQGGPWPLVVYGHGTLGYPENATHIVRHLVERGYVVVAPVFPLTSSVSFTGITRPGMFDTPNQPGDVSFVIDRMLADKVFSPAIDETRIGCLGHSLGAITCYFASFGMQTRDARIKASAMMGAGDPVQAALASDFGFDGVAHAPVSTPALFLTGDRDIFARIGGRPHGAYSRIEGPKYEVVINGGVHVWFKDDARALADGKNPDCLFFEKNLPGAVMPGCELRGGLVDPAVQQEIARVALLAFFDGYLKGDTSAITALQHIGNSFPDVELLFEQQ